METTKNLMASSLSTGKSSFVSHSLQASTCTTPNQTIPGTSKKVMGTTLKVNELATVLHSWKSIDNGIGALLSSMQKDLHPQDLHDSNIWG
jgi:hypothetical protein